MFAKMCALVALAVVAPSFVHAEEGIAVGSLAPALPSGKWVTTDGSGPEVQGKVLLVEFWFAGCPSCRANIPHVNQLYRKYAPLGLVVVAPSLDGEATVRQLKQSQGINYPLQYSGSATANAYGVSLFPTMFLVGKNGRVIWKGNFGDAELAFCIEAALKK